jgi:hypothetical protein
MLLIAVSPAEISISDSNREYGLFKGKPKEPDAIVFVAWRHFARKAVDCAVLPIEQSLRLG